MAQKSRAKTAPNIWTKTAPEITSVLYSPKRPHFWGRNGSFHFTVYAEQLLNDGKPEEAKAVVQEVKKLGLRSQERDNLGCFTSCFILIRKS